MVGGAITVLIAFASVGEVGFAAPVVTMRGRHATRVAIRTFVGARDTAVIPHLSAIRARVKAAIHGRRIDASPRGASGLSRLLEHAAAEGFAALEATVDEGLIHVLVAVLIGPR